MKAIVYKNYGSPDVLHLEEVKIPTPGDDQVLIKIMAASLNAADWHLLRADPFLARFYAGLFKPKFPILGADVSGTVEAVGKNVTRFKVGDEVFGDLFKSGFGGLAEYACAYENSIVKKPSSISFDEAASIPMAAMTAVQGLRDMGQIQSGQKVLINGASGGVGTFAVQIAKLFGGSVTAVCSTGNMELARSLGADHVIDYTKEDFTKNGENYDIILAVNGFHPLSDYMESLRPSGKYVMVGGTNAQMFQALLQGPWKSMNNSKKMGALTLDESKKLNDMTFVKDQVEAGNVRVVIDKRFPLLQTVQAFQYLEKGHAKGKIVITIGT